MRLVSAVFVLLLAVAPAVVADDKADNNLCPCVPIAHLWTVKTCADWTCAATELAVANGDTQVIAVPVGINDTRWLVVRRLASGSFTNTIDDPYRLEQFDGFDSAANRFSAMTVDFKPVIMTAPDGKVLVMSLRTPEPKHRAVAH
jgi:hypothetical protein